VLAVKSEIKSVEGVIDAQLSVKTILENFYVLLIKERNILELASDATDEGTASLMSDYITQTEKKCGCLMLI